MLAHLARNADALLNVLAARPMYVSGEARDADIERDAQRTAADHREDVRESAPRLDGAFAAQSEAGWERTVELRNGVTDLARAHPVPALDRGGAPPRRPRHRLRTGRSARSRSSSANSPTWRERFSGHPGVPASLELRTEDGRRWHTGAPEGVGTGSLVIAGSPTALVGWLTGRSTGGGLSARDPLPDLPAL